jgi:VWFA-related protein
LQYTIFRCVALMILHVALISAFIFNSTHAQEKQKREEFGSSLNRWWGGEKKQKNTETKKGANRTDPEVVISLETSLAVFDILVLDKEGRTVSGLRKEDFVIAEDAAPQEVASLSLGDGSIVPRSIVLIIDHSDSQLPFIENSILAAKTVVNKLKPNDRMAIVTDDISLLVDFTGDKRKLNEALDSLGRKVKSGRPGRSEQYSALLAALTELIVGAERPIIIFQTDGDELEMLRSATSPRPVESNPSKIRGRFKPYSLEDLTALAEKTRATVYAVIPGIKFVEISHEERLGKVRTLFEKQFKARTGGTWRPQAPGFEDSLQRRAQTLLRQQLALARIAKLTGGWAEYLEEPDQAVGIYDRIFAGIEQRYILTYYPTNTKRDGSLRKVDIKVRNHPEYVFVGKRSYYAVDR